MLIRFALLALALVLLSLASTAQQQRGIKIQYKARAAADAPIAGSVDLYPKSYALVIGNDLYTNGWSRLSNGVKDARAVAQTLEDIGFDVTLKLNLKRRDFERSIEDWIFQYGGDKNARLFIWYAGHGHTDSSGEGYLVPVDAPSPAADEFQFKRYGLNMREFGTWVRTAQSRHIFAVFDSCFAGTVFNSARAAPPPAITLATTKPVRQFLTSGDADQTVSDDGSFRELFIEALTGKRNADANADGYLTASELGLFMTDSITNYSEGKQTPRHGKLRDKRYDQGDFVFAQLKAPAPAVAAPAPAATATADPKTALDAAIWGAIKDSRSSADFKDYIARADKGEIPGIFRNMASGRLAALSASGATAKPVASSPASSSAPARPKPKPANSGTLTDAFDGPQPSAFPRALQGVARRAFAGDIAAQKELGVRYRDRNGLRSSKLKSQLWFKKAAEQGDKEAALMVLEGWSTTSENDTEFAKLVALADTGYIPAVIELVKYYDTNGYATDRRRDPEKARYYIDKLAASDHPDGLLRAAEYYWRYHDHGNGDVDKAYQLFNRAAQVGDATHKFALAKRYEGGFAFAPYQYSKGHPSYGKKAPSKKYRDPDKAYYWLIESMKGMRAALNKPRNLRHQSRSVGLVKNSLNTAIVRFAWPSIARYGDWNKALFWAKLYRDQSRPNSWGAGISAKWINCLTRQIDNNTPPPRSYKAGKAICNPS